MQRNLITHKATIVVLLLAGVLLGPAVCAKAQTDYDRNYMRGYLFIAPSAVSHWGTGYAVGGGAEQRLWKLVGAGADLSGIIPGSRAASNSIGFANFNLYAHWEPKGKVDLFGTAGYALLLRTFVANGYDFGGGINYWMHEKLGVTFEAREEAASRVPAGVPVHYVEFRIGLTFR